MKRVAIIGTREPSEKGFEYVRKQAGKFVARGWIVTTGAADGVDHAAMLGASDVDPSKLHVYLPWVSYNRDKIPTGANITVYNEEIHEEWGGSVYQFHPAAKNLTRGPFALHARNYGIVRPVDLVVALPSNKPGGGGTGQGMRIAQHYGIPLLDLNKKEDQKQLIDHWLKLETLPDASEASYVHVVQGDLLASDCTAIGHQANCMSTMGAGIAKRIREQYPEAYYADKNFGPGSGNPYAPSDRLGKFSYTFYDRLPLVVFNMYGQLQYGRDKRYTDYEALEQALSRVLDECCTLRMGGYPLKFGLPYGMGCANAGGDWNVVSQIIERLANKYKIPVYLYKL